jgi:hypothetical protein
MMQGNLRGADSFPRGWREASPPVTPAGFAREGIVNGWAGTNGSAGCWTHYE